MQFSLISGVVSALLIGSAMAGVVDTENKVAVRSVVSECSAKNDCCFSTIGACRRQSKLYLDTYLTCNLLKWCPSLGISYDQCRADCCSISGKSGRGCPGK